MTNGALASWWETRSGRSLALAVLVVFLAVWLWPIGFGGGMPVGGDVTQFSMGLMAVLRRALRSGRLPLWNELWGYGFPGVGESQMGVFYPPHWLLYGLPPLEVGYTASLVLHTLWGGLGAWWAGRRFGMSVPAATLCAASWSTCGFFLIHLSHQWGYTTGCWLPWAWGLAWVVLTNPTVALAPFWLALVLTVQLLPGHFQLAFITQLGVLLLAGERVVEGVRGGAARLRPVGRVLLAWMTAYVLAALQIWPTLRLARLAAPRRDFEYLSGFAATPLHLVSWLAPGLFERSPLWRPIVWDPFHTSPEEYLGYVGLAPLFLAVGFVRREAKRRPEARALAVVGFVSLLLALGPYVPGFSLVCQLPGFSFFRAPARWVIALSMAMALLAGLGLDSLRDRLVPDIRRGIGRFVVLGLVIPLAVVSVVEVGLSAGGRGSRNVLTGAYEAALLALPWHEEGLYGRVLEAASRPNLDLRVQESLARQGVRLAEAPRPVFQALRWAIYREELLPTLVLLTGLGALAALARRRNHLEIGFLVLTLIDLWLLGRTRRVDVEALGDLVGRSPVLGRLAQTPGARTLDPVRNLPMVAGVAPVSAYRTLDLPALDRLTTLAQLSPANPGQVEPVQLARRLTGARWRVIDALEMLEEDRQRQRDPMAPASQVIEDPALAGWRFGVDWVRQVGPRVQRFRLDQGTEGGTLAWYLTTGSFDRAALLGPWSGDPLTVLRVVQNARPLSTRRVNPEHFEVDLDEPGGGWIVVTQLADPQWQAVWRRGDESREATIARAFGRAGQGAWQAIEVPSASASAGRWTLVLTYVATDVKVGLAVSAGAWVIYLGALFRAVRRMRFRDRASVREVESQ